ncbi:DNA-binding protein WhiA [Kocuria rhizophila]|nr:DNA-binding protein WhiA [Kocuria rhizophila]
MVHWHSPSGTRTAARCTTPSTGRGLPADHERGARPGQPRPRPSTTRRSTSMALTASVKEELAHLQVRKSAVRAAELSAPAGASRAGCTSWRRIVVEAELDTESGGTPRSTHGGGGLWPRLRARGDQRRRSAPDRHLWWCGSPATARPARRTGLLDAHGRPVRGLPPTVVNGSVEESAAAIRGAFLAHGSTEPGRAAANGSLRARDRRRPSRLRAPRALDVLAKARQVRGVDRVVVRDGDTIAALLTRLGAHRARLQWRTGACERRRGPRPTGSRTSTTPTSGVPRRPPSRRRAEVERALDSPGRGRPSTCARPGGCAWPTSRRGPDELGRLSDPPLTEARSRAGSAGCWPWPTAAREELGVATTTEFAAQAGGERRRG